MIEYDRKFKKILCGIDEVGYGSLIGPVVSCAITMCTENTLIGINDSKKLNSKKRNQLYQQIIENSKFGIGIATVKEINKLNILQANFLSMERAVKNLIDTHGEIFEHILIDGNRSPEFSYPYSTVIDGDATSYTIACASIIAKVTRDKMIDELAVKHPEYLWHKNKGYGTKEHIEAIRMHGLTEHHREAFVPKQLRISQLDLFNL